MQKPLHLLGAALLVAGSLHADIMLYNCTAQTSGAPYDFRKISKGWVIS